MSLDLSESVAVKLPRMIEVRHAHGGNGES